MEYSTNIRSTSSAIGNSINSNQENFEPSPIDHATTVVLTFCLRTVQKLSMFQQVGVTGVVSALSLHELLEWMLCSETWAVC